MNSKNELIMEVDGVGIDRSIEKCKKKNVDNSIDIEENEDHNIIVKEEVDTTFGIEESCEEIIIQEVNDISMDLKRDRDLDINIKEEVVIPFVSIGIEQDYTKSCIQMNAKEEQDNIINIKEEPDSSNEFECEINSLLQGTIENVSSIAFDYFVCLIYN